MSLIGRYTHIMKHIILASQSPRRSALLRAMGVTFDTIPSKFDEKLDDSRDPVVVAKELALGKAMDIAKQYPDAYVIGSDTIVTINGRQLEKPMSPEHAHEMLKDLAGTTNYVTTAVAVVCMNDNVRLQDADTTAVHFKSYDEAAVSTYVATGDPMDKAGAYGIQSGAGPLIEDYEGNYDTIIGLPTGIVADLLGKCGVAAKALTADEQIKHAAM
jgi:septum formation protein